MTAYDALVLGVGGVGSAALAELALRGVRVLGVDRFEPGHDRGSSHGDTRLIRLAYCEHPDYVPLLRRAYEHWEGWQAASPVELFRPSGVLEAGPSDSPLVSGVRRAAAEHDLILEELSAGAARVRFPGLRLPDDYDVLVEPHGGVLRVENAVRSRVAAALAAGAELRAGVEVLAWEVTPSGVRVRLSGEGLPAGGEIVEAARLVLTPGAWAPDLLSDVGVPFEVVRKVLLWCPTRSAVYTPSAGFLPFAVQHPDGEFVYGFPELEPGRLKLAEHTGGAPVVDPLTVERRCLEADTARVAAFAEAHLPDVEPAPCAHTVCLYTRTPDEHFALGAHPASDRVVFAAGLSGHGYKFAPVLGEALADLVLDGGTAQPVGFLAPQRFA